MAFTGFRLLRPNPRGVNFPMLTGIGLPNKRNGCCLRQMLPRLIGGSRYSLRSGNTRWPAWEMNGGSTRSAPMEWRAPKFTMMANDEFTRPELDSALGRLQWATTCCPLTKPFLQAFWQWRIAVKSSGRPSKLLRNFATALQLVRQRLQAPSFLCSPEPMVGG